ncbi:MAG: hypothetical protein GC147_00275 [Porphyrobacter sp.]|nr:hypothetical protein [Porphyrobacter sp.]
MHVLSLPVVALALLGAAAPAPPAPQPRAATREIAPLAPAPEICRDRITQVREAAGKPALDRTPASPDRAHRIYAVDKRIDGCAVMVMHGDVSDIRPLPAPPAGPPRMMQVRSGQ